MLCNHAKSHQCLLLLFTLLVGFLVACGGDEPAPAPPPPPPPPRPVFVPVDVVIELGTSGEQLTLQTTEAGGHTLNGEAFASGTTVEAAGNTYRLTLADGEWKAEYVAPRPWATALGTSGDALLITQREDGLFEAGDAVFSSGGTITASNGNQYRLTLVDNAWQVEYLPPEPVAVLLGMSGETILVERLEGGGYSVGEQRVVDGSTVQSSTGGTYRLAMQDGVWTATFVPPPAVVVQLGTSGQTVMLQIGENGQYQRDGQPFASGTEVSVAGNTYRVTFADGQWMANFVAPPPEVVSLGISGQTVTLQRGEDGQYQRDGQPFASGTEVSAAGNTYRLTFANGQWMANFVAPPPEIVQLPGTGQTVILERREDGQYYRGGQLFASGSEVEVGGETFRLTLQNGQWTAVSQAPVIQMVTLGTSDVTLTLQRSPDGTWTIDGVRVRNGDVERVGNNRYRLLLEDGEWSAQYLRDTIPVEGAGGLIVLFREEDGSLTYNGETVRDGSIITQDGRTYELVRLTDGWLATPAVAPPAAGDQNVSLPGSGQTITLTRTSDGSYTYENAAVTQGRVITVGGIDYRLNRDAQGVWSAQRVRDLPDVSTGGVAGPTQTDTVNTFTDTRFDDGDPSNAVAANNEYGVQLSTRGEQPENADDRGTKIVPQRDDADHVEFPVYDLMQQNLVHRERTYVEAAKAKLQEIVDIIVLNKELYARDARDPDDHIADDGTATGTIGLWRQAELAVGKIFGLTDFTEPDGIFGSDPWSGQTLDLDEVDDVIVALQDAIAALSDVARFGREFEDQIVNINDPDGTPGNADDLSPKLDAADFYNGLMSRIRFGSTASTRFGAYVVKQKDDSTAGTVSDAARGGWVKGVFAYTPNDPPVGTEVPDRGEATYRGDTVAVSAVPTTNGTVQDGNTKGATLFAGKIELVASFTRKSVKGTITELKDESGRTWEHDAGLGASAVKSIVLPDASLTDSAGFYAGTGAATATFEDTSRRNATGEAADLLRVQLVDDAVEALGVWEAFGLEGAFGATRTGTVSKPTLPSETDRGGGANVGSIFYIDNDAAAASGAGGPITPDTEASTFSLDRGSASAGLGIAGTGLITAEEFDRDFTDLLLTDLYRRSRLVRSSSRGFVSEARDRISRMRTGLTETNFSTRAADASSTLSTFLGITKTLSTAGDDAAAQRNTVSSEIGKAVSALQNASSLHRALTYDDDDDTRDGFFLGGLTTRWTLEETQQVVSEKRWDFRYDFGHNRYTRFGVWAQIAPLTATGNIAGSTDAPNHGSFAYSPLRPTVGADVTGLTFIAKYEGRTLAVNESTGNLYGGQFILTVNWDPPNDAAPAVETTITDLRGVRGTSDYLKWNSRDVKSIFFSGITATDGTLGGTVAVSIRYRDSSLDTPAGAGISATMSGTFVMDEVFTDEPVGVLGVWSITDTGTTVDDYSGSFGAELKP